MEPNQLTGAIIGAAIEVHRELGPGKTERAYQEALSRELALRALPHLVQRPVPVVYKGLKLECGYRLDLLVADTVVVEVKSVEALIPVHEAQTLTYLKLGGWRLGLLLNFNVAVLKEGIQRLILGFLDTGIYPEQPPPATPPYGPAAKPDKADPFFASPMPATDQQTERLAHAVLDSAIEVHRELGPGLLPSAYEECLCYEFRCRNLPFERRQPLPLNYKGTLLAEGDEIGLLVGGRLIVSPLAVGKLQPVHEAQLLSQLHHGGWPLGLLLNFNSVRLADGICRLVLTPRR